MRKYIFIGMILVLSLILVGCNNGFINNKGPEEIKVTDASTGQKVEWSNATSLNLWEDRVLVNIVENDVVLDYTEKSENAQKITLSGFEGKPKYLAIMTADNETSGTLYVLTDTGVLYLQAIPEIGESWEQWKDKKLKLDTDVEKIAIATSVLAENKLCFTLKADKVIRRAGETKSYDEEIQIYNQNKAIVLGEWKPYEIQNDIVKGDKGLIELFEINKDGTYAITNDYKFINKLKSEIKVENDIKPFDIFHKSLELIYVVPGNNYTNSALIELTEDDTGANILKLTDETNKQTVLFKK
jgi:hypothetical protein